MAVGGDDLSSSDMAPSDLAGADLLSVPKTFGLSVAVKYPVPTSPIAIAAADLDGQKGPDVVVGNSGTNGLNVFLNKGDGTFVVATGSPYNIGAIADVALADVDGAFGPDIVAASPSALKVEVLLNKGDGTFQAAKPFGNNANNGLAVGKFKTTSFDIAYATDGTGNTGAVGVLLNVGPGNGYFSDQGSYAAGTNNATTTHLATADFDGKNGTDILVGNAGSSSMGMEARILLNKGDGTFDTMTQPAYALTGPLGGIAVGDLDGKNGVDFAVVDAAAIGGVIVYLNNGTGAFQPSAGSPYVLGGYGGNVAIGDIDQQNGPDLIVTSTKGVEIFLNDGSGGFTKAPGSPFSSGTAAGSNPYGVTLADLDGKNGLDVIVTNTDDTFAVLLNSTH